MSEQLRLQCGQGSYVHLTLPIPPARVIPELQPTLWVKASQPGLQLMMRVVLPRTRDPVTGSPLTAVLRGDSYRRAGEWQQLGVRDLDTLLTRETQILRTRLGSHVDSREAYVDLMVLNAFGKAGVIDVWMDDLSLAGFVAMPRTEEERGEERTAGPGRGAPATPTAVRPAAFQAEPTTDPRNSVQIKGTVLEVQERPFMPRVIEHQGEAFSWLQSLGFNTVHLNHQPTAAECDEARRLDLWLIAPAPEQPEALSGEDRMLAWELGTGDAAWLEQRAAKARAYGREQRPLICWSASPGDGPAAGAQIVVPIQTVLGTHWELSSYTDWLRRSRLGTPPCMYWAYIPTQPSPATLEQIQLLGGREAADISFSADSLRALAWAAAAGGARGFYVASRRRLDSGSPADDTRALSLHWLNQELALLEPWVAAGGLAGSTTTAEVRTDVLDTERAKLVLVQRVQPLEQHVLAPVRRRPLPLVVPGTSNSSSAYRIGPCGLIPLRQRRDSGGIRVQLENEGRDTLLLVTSDPLVVHRLSQQLALHRSDAMNLQAELLGRQLRDTEAVLRRLATPAPAVANWARRIDDAAANYQQCLRLRDQRNGEEFFRRADEIRSTLTALRRLTWEQTAQAGGGPGIHPALMQFETLPAYGETAAGLTSRTLRANALAGGDFESLEQLLQSGWRQRQGAADGLEAHVDLAPDAHSGRFALRLQVVKRASPAGSCSGPVVSITSGPLPVSRGDVLRVQGWVRLVQPVSGPQGLEIRDTFGGESLALRLRSGSDWRPFTFYRAAPRDADFRLTFALSDVGEVWIDDVTACVLNGAAEATYPVSTPASTPAAPR